MNTGTKLRGVSYPSPSLKNFAVSQGKNGGKCASAGKSAGKRTIGELLLQKSRSQARKSRKATSLTSPPKFCEVTA